MLSNKILLSKVKFGRPQIIANVFLPPSPQNNFYPLEMYVTSKRIHGLFDCVLLEV